MSDPTSGHDPGAIPKSVAAPGRAGVQIAGMDSDDVGRAESGEFTIKSRTQWQMIRRRFFRHRLAMGSLTVLIALVILAYVGLPLWKYPYNVSGTLQNGGQPTLDVIPWLDGDGMMIGEHPFGQDTIGRDYFAVTLRGAQQSLVIATVAGLLATVIGTVLGALSGFYRGVTDTIIMRFVDVMFTIPLLLVAAVLGRRFGSSSIFVLALIIALASWLTTSRIIRAEFMSLREKEDVEAARALGASNKRIIWRHIMPNAIGSIVVTATLLISAAILVETALSFLGLGVGGSDWSLGKQVATYQTAFTTRPWLFWWPGMFIVTIALCINFIGDGLRDAFDPKQTRVRQ